MAPKRDSRRKSPGRVTFAPDAVTPVVAVATPSSASVDTVARVHYRWAVYFVYFAAELYTLWHAGFRTEFVCAALHCGLMWRATYWDSAAYWDSATDAVDFYMHMKLLVNLVSLCAETQLGAPMAAFDTVFEWLPTESATYAADSTVRGYQELHHLRLAKRLGKIVEQERKIRRLWQSVSVAVALFTAMSHKRVFPGLLFAACVYRSTM